MPTPVQSAEALWQEGLALLVAFEALASHPDPARLKAAAACLHQSLKLDSGQVQPYVGLAYISYLLADSALAADYIALAEAIDPAFPPLQSLKAQMGEG